MKQLLLLGLFTIIYGLNGNIKGTVNLPSIHYEHGKSIDIPCASSDFMSNSSFATWGKVWRVNQSESFDASHLTFIDDNATLRIQSVDNNDFGYYECCVHVYAYEDFLCFVTELLIPDSVIDVLNGTAAGKNQTESLMPPAWNVDLVGINTLNAYENNTYFIRIFEMNVTDIKCIKDGNTTSLLKTVGAKKIFASFQGNNFPSPIFSDALIPKFIASIHQGIYTCNGTYHNGNETETILAEFEVVSTSSPNIHALLLDSELVKNYRNSQMSIIVFPTFVLLIIIGLRY